MTIEESDFADGETHIDQWAKDLEEAAKQIPAEEHDGFIAALA